MRKFVLLAAALALATGPALAQQAPPAAKGPQNNAVNTSNTPTPASPVQGSNSFTEGEAKSRIEAKGFTNVSNLKKDDSGVWRGQASKEGRTVSVSLDYQGNVVTR